MNDSLATSRPFRRRSALHASSVHFGPNMTPMVDVVMVILIFFMVSAAFLGPEWFLSALIPKEAPPAPAQPTKADGTGATPPPAPAALEPMRLTLRLRTDNARTFISGYGDTETTLDDMAKRLTDLTKGLEPSFVKDRVEVILAPAQDVPYKDVVRAHELIRQTGIERIGHLPQ